MICFEYKMIRSSKTDNKEEDEQLEMLESWIWLNFILLPKYTKL